MTAVATRQAEPGHRGAGVPTGPAVAVAVQQPAGTAGLSRRRPVSTISDQRPAQQRLGGRVDQTQHVLLHALQGRGVGRLGGRIQTPGIVDGLDKPG
ncbi:hypothetical protein BST45_19320 [Mycobacterium shinjukuense]|nr:hypothetical protein BST45_19320 [Mycobacterium shinjukuense]